LVIQYGHYVVEAIKQSGDNGRKELKMTNKRGIMPEAGIMDWNAGYQHSVYTDWRWRQIQGDGTRGNWD
jgi:hypothetical protein